MMHVVLGDGEMTRRELTQTLADLWKAAVDADQPFWFVVQGKATPTDTDRHLVTWLEKNEIYYEIVTDDADSVAEIYAEPQETHVAKRLGQKVVALLQSKPEENEDADILALFADVNDASAAEDRWVNGIIQQAYDAGFPTLALNDGLVEVDLSQQAEEAEAEPEEERPAAKKSAAKKTVAKKAAARPEPVATVDTDVSAEDESEPGGAPAAEYTRDQLEDMEPTQIKEVAASMGIQLPPRTRATTYIDHILGEAKGPAPEAEVAEAPSINGDQGIDIEALADSVADRLIERITKLLTKA